MSQIVYKLGGTSQCKKGYDRLINILKEKQDCTIFIVLSAVSGVTNNLVKFTETKDISYIDKAIHLNQLLLKDLDIEHMYIYYLYKELRDKANEFIKSFNISDIYIKSEIIGYGEILSSDIFEMYLTLQELPKKQKLYNSHKLLNSYDYIFSKKKYINVIQMLNFLHQKI